VLNGTTAGVGEAFSRRSSASGRRTFSACEVAAVFLLPFVAIRLVSGDRQSGALKIEMQHPIPATYARVGAKAVVLLGRLGGGVPGAVRGGTALAKATAAASSRRS